MRIQARMIIHPEDHEIHLKALASVECLASTDYEHHIYVRDVTYSFSDARNTLACRWHRFGAEAHLTIDADQVLVCPDPKKTLAEIEDILSKFDACSIGEDFHDGDRRIIGRSPRPFVFRPWLRWIRPVHESLNCGVMPTIKTAHLDSTSRQSWRSRNRKEATETDVSMMRDWLMKHPGDNFMMSKLIESEKLLAHLRVSNSSQATSSASELPNHDDEQV